MEAYHDQPIDGGRSFDFGRTAADYAKFRDIYPESMYRKLLDSGIVRSGMNILDVGTGSGVIPRHLAASGARFYASDLSAEQIAEARRLSCGMPIVYAVAPAEHSPFEGVRFDLVSACQCFWYFNIPEFLAELKRILKPEGGFCRISMEWLPFESRLAAETERIVLQFNPDWTGGGYRVKNYAVPDWAKSCFDLETLFAYRENLPFTVDSWCGRMRSCRGIGATLPPEEVERFDAALRRCLEENSVGETFEIPHYIRVELFRWKPSLP